jgi:hypothetical protein
LSAPPSDGPAVVLLLCDPSHRLLLAVVVDGATAGGVPSVVNLALEVAEPAGVAGIVVGIVQQRLGQYLPKPDVASLAGLADRCSGRGVALLDLLLVGPRGWKSVHHLAAAPGGDEDGNQ